MGGWSGSSRGGVGGVGWLMQGWGGSCRDMLGHSGVGGSCMVGWGGWVM